MADENTRGTLADLGLGISETTVVGNLDVMDKFLSGAESLEEITEEGEEETPPAQTSKKKPVPAKKPAAQPSKKEGEDDEEEEEEKGPSVEELLLENEEEEEEQTGDENKDEEEEENKDETPTTQFEDLSKELIALGVFSEEDGETVPKTGEEFLEKFQREKQLGATQWLDNFISRFGEDRQQLFEDIFINGVDPQEYMPVYNEVLKLDSLDLSNVKNQERVFKEFYKRQGVSDEKIELRLQKSIDNGFLEEDAKDYHEQLVEQDKQALERQVEQKKAMENAALAADEAFKNGLMKVLQEKVKSKEFNGIPFDDKLSRGVYDFLYTKKYKTTDGQLFTEFDKFILETKKPENIEQRALIAALKLTNFDFSKITKRAISKESNTLFSSLTEKREKAKSKKSSTATAASSKNWLELA